MSSPRVLAVCMTYAHRGVRTSVLGKHALRHCRSEGRNRNACSRPLSTAASPQPLPFSAVPGPRELPLVGTMLGMLLIDPATSHLYIKEQGERYGPIVKAKLGKFSMVTLTDAEDIRYVLSKEGKFPQRQEFTPWKHHRDDTGRLYGPLLSDGAQWQKLRSALNRHMMRPYKVALHTEDFNLVVDDVMDIIQAKEKTNGAIDMQNLADVMFHWSLESALTIMYDERFGCLREAHDPDIERFIQAVHEILDTSVPLFLLPPAVYKGLRLGVWRRHVKAWDTTFEIGSGYVSRKMAQVQSAPSDGAPVSGLIATLMEQGDLSEDEIISSLMDLMTAAVDTTSNSVLWCIYLLSRHQDKQDLLRDELNRVAPDGQRIGTDQLQDMRYMKAFVKETLRLYPVIPFISRILDEDIVLKGYNIPAGTILSMAMWSMRSDPALYTDPESFQPERWLRENLAECPIHPHSSLPFGFGPRSCIGRRVAELEIFLLIGRLLQNYRILPKFPEKTVDAQSKLFIMPKSPVEVMFEPLKK